MMDEPKELSQLSRDRPFRQVATSFDKACRADADILMQFGTPVCSILAAVFTAEFTINQAMLVGCII